MRYSSIIVDFSKELALNIIRSFVRNHSIRLNGVQVFNVANRFC